jgi:signal peptidase I
MNDLSESSSSQDSGASEVEEAAEQPQDAPAVHAAEADDAAAQPDEVLAGAVAGDLPAAKDESDSWWELLRILSLALLIALVERTFFFQPYNIPSGSMEDTLLIGDYLFVEKFSYGYSKFSFPWGRLLPSFGRVIAHSPERGDVAVFALPSDPSTDFIKRIVGLPGDRVQMISGVLYLNDRPVPKVRVGDFVENDTGYEHHIAKYRETLPSGKSYYVLDSIPDGPLDTTPVYVVPAGHYFMMGDNRDDSDDSRGIVGYVPAENLVGRAEFKFFSIDGTKTQWWSFWTWPWAVRYDRLFKFID